MERKTDGWVYFVGNRKYGLYKIGKASCVEARVASIQTGCPFDLEVISKSLVDNAFQYEKELHHKFAKCRIRGEWFKFTSEELEQAIEIFKMRGFNDFRTKGKKSLSEPVLPVCPDVSSQGVRSASGTSPSELSRWVWVPKSNPPDGFSELSAKDQETYYRRKFGIPSYIPVNSIQFKMYIGDM